VTSAEEKRTIKSILKWVDRPGGGLAGSRWFFPVVWLSLIAVTAGLYVVGHSARFEVVALVSFLVGLAYWHAFILSSAARSWPVLAKYVDRESLERRLRELEA
jgi:hypothetical protein